MNFKMITAIWMTALALTWGAPGFSDGPPLAPSNAPAGPLGPSGEKGKQSRRNAWHQRLEKLTPEEKKQVQDFRRNYQNLSPEQREQGLNSLPVLKDLK